MSPSDDLPAAGRVAGPKPMPYVPCSVEFPVEENPFESLGVDLTFRCNMSCRYCYNPRRTWADMDLSYFEEACRRLPGPVTFKFLGGEPALHPQFFGFITTADRYGHRVFSASNGRCYADRDFVRQLSQLEASFGPGLSMDGGYTRDDVYHFVTGAHC